MRLLLLFCVGLWMALPGQAQDRIRNVRVRVVEGSQIEIRYDLTKTQPGDSVYIEMLSRLKGPIPVRLEFVRGDVGIHISAGTDRRIIWDALANGFALNEEIQARVFLKTGVLPTVAVQPVVPAPAAKETEPSPAKTRKQKRRQARVSVFSADSSAAESVPSAPVVMQTPVPTKTDAAMSAASAPTTIVTPAVGDTVKLQAPKAKTRYAGPAWALLSAVAPGIGNIFVQTPKPKIGARPVLTLVCYGLVAYGLGERKQSQDAYAMYEIQKNAAEGASYYQTANDHHHKYFLATRGAMVVAAADVVLTFIRGLRNQRLQKEAARFQGFSVRPGMQVGQPTAVLRYSF